MKKAGLFPKIIYYIFTFLVGILLAFTLPNAFFEFVESPRFVTERLEKGDFYSVMLMTGNYFNKEPVLIEEFEDGGGIFLFETVMPVTTADEKEAVGSDTYTLYKTYLGYIYGVKDTYQTYKTNNNATKLVITNLQNRSIEIEILDMDKNGDKKLDGCATAMDFGFVHISIPEAKVESIQKLSLIDCNGKEFWSSNEVSLDFQSEFYLSTNDFIEKYNDLLIKYNNAQTNAQRDAYDKQLEETYYSFRKELTDKSDKYVVVDKDNAEYYATKKLISKPANVKASLIIVSYFIVIYIIADFLLGSHYIIKFFRWFLYSVCKVKPKNRQKFKKNEIFGHDYYSSVTLSLDLEQVPDFNESVQVKYTNSDVEIVFILLKENNYTATERIKAGTYVNPFIDMNRAYAPVDLPDNLEVEGYKMDLKIKIIKREV